MCADIFCAPRCMGNFYENHKNINKYIPMRILLRTETPQYHDKYVQRLNYAKNYTITLKYMHKGEDSDRKNKGKTKA